VSNVPGYPLEFEPFFRPMPWGGHRLADWIDEAVLPADPVGEAWLLSDHPLHVSRVANGPLRGTSLHRLLTEFGSDLLGFSASRFPLLLKLLDARQTLSVQVHPDDEAARLHAPLEGGKTEAWLVLDADPDSVIYLGLEENVSRDDVSRAMEEGTLPQCLRAYRPRPGECYFVPAGAVHALGGGLVVLEVQQTSDATFRMYDWGRLDAHGRPRPLHPQAALAVLKERFDKIGRQDPVPIPSAPTLRSEVLVECPYFRLVRHVNLADSCGEVRVAPPCILVGLSGRTVVDHPGASVGLRRGRAVLVPTVREPVPVRSEGPAAFVEIRACQSVAAVPSASSGSGVAPGGGLPLPERM